MDEHCVFYKEGDCGEHKVSRKSGIYQLSSLEVSVNKQLEKIGFYPKQNVSEVQLISNRSQQDISTVEGVICAFHRFKYGTFWQPSRRCAHPEHTVHPAKRKETVRTASWKVYLHWNLIFPSFPMGGMLCSKHRIIDDLNHGAEIGDQNHSEETADPNYQPPAGTLYMNETERDQCKQQMCTFTETAAPDMSPLKFQITSPVTELSKSSIYYAKRKYKEAKNNFKKKFCENFAPEQGKELEKVLSSSPSSESESDVPESLQHIVRAYESAVNSKTKILILSVLSPNDLSKHDTMHFFKCTKYEVDKARQWRSTYGPGAFEVPEKTTRRKLDIHKCEHFLHYLFESGAIQDVAYGASTLVYDSGEKQIVPRAILTAMKTHTILQYHQFCSEVNYTPLSKSSLLHILKILKPSQRHSLAGLDNTTVEGLDGFQMLQNIINECAADLEKKQLNAMLQKAQRYLKLGYALHCSENSQCTSHCTVFALSDANDNCFKSLCEHEHNEICDECCNVFQLLDSTSKIVLLVEDTAKKNEMVYDANLGKNYVMNWMRHILRGVQQNKSKTTCMNEVNNTTSFWLKDWAQKVIPTKYREAQKDYFGKRGMSLHIDVFFYKEENCDTLKKEVYFTCLFRCDQDIIDTLNIAAHVLAKFHSDHPNVVSLYSKSDNAGCYGGNGCAEVLYLLCKENGITLLCHDFNEPQKGKDQADRESAIARKYMKAYVDNGNDLMTAHDLKKAILYMGGVRNSQVSVIEVDKEKTQFSTEKLSNISSYHSVKFNEDSMIYWQYYEIGIGKCIKYTNPTFIPSFTVVDPFSKTSSVNVHTSSKKPRLDKQYLPFLFCTEDGCTESFKTEKLLEDHLNHGKHTFIPIRSSMDMVKKMYSERLHVTTTNKLNPLQDPLSMQTQECNEPHVQVNAVFSEPGWALPKRKSARFSQKQKKFLYDLFIRGETSGRKISPEKAVKEMRTAIIKENKKMFTPQEYLTKSQIQSLFSRMSAEQKSGKLQPPAAMEMEDMIDEEDLSDEMYQRKEKSDKITSGSPEGILDLFRLLESTNPEEVESIKNVIHENLSTAKDSKLLNSIVEYYLAVQSERSLDILVRVKDPHDKHLFDKINDLIKAETTSYQSLQLLCNLIYRQPSWIYKIAGHRLMHSLFHLLKNDGQAPNLISALLIIVCLLPMIPSQFGPFLQDTFDVFSRLIAWNIKKPSAISETYILHLQVAVYSLFHRLYGMFPCNFLAYLRSYYGGRDYREENFRIFTLFIKPMLERVRLHPLLVTASKETELSANRWKKMEYHDVITDCAAISLDAIEGTLEGLRGKNQNINAFSRRHGNFNAQNSMQYVSLSSQSSVTSVTLEPGSAVDEAIASHRGSLWSPSHSYSSNAPPPSILDSSTSSLMNKDESEINHPETQLSVEENVPLDLAVEAKPEDLKSESKTSFLHQKLEKSISNDSNKINISFFQDDPCTSKRDSIDRSSMESVNSSIEKNVLRGVEVKEEDTDKEVSELTSVQNKSMDISSGDQRHDTPFCCTTQTLTDEPKNLLNSAEIKSDMLTKSHEDDVDEMYNSMQDAEEETYVPSFNRYRYVSQCGPPPVIPSDSLPKPKVTRSISCPAKFCSSSQISIIPERNGGSDSVSKSDAIVATCSSSVITTSSAFVSISTNVILAETRNFTYEQLIPMAMEPLPDICRPPNASLESNYCSYNTLFSSLSPPELLDNYIQLGNVTYSNQLSSIPITSTKNTDWTHFGGKPPPDEVDILRNQILLLHNQLLFERHRKDIHSERIRRILGRAKKSKIQEELIIALKEQINLLVKDNEELKYEVSRQTRMNDRFKIEKKQIETELNSLIKKLKFENTELLFSNKKLQSLLVTQKEENDQIIFKCKATQSRIVDLETELDLCKQEVECYRKLKQESEFLSKQLFLLQEINNVYKEKIDQLKEVTNPNNINDDLFNEAAAIEINDLKKKLESTCFHYDAAKSKILELEQQLNSIRQTEKEQFKLIESMKSFHQDQIKVCDHNLTEQKKISIQKDTCILQLCKEKELLSKKIDTLERKISGASSPASRELCDNNTCHVQENIDLCHSSDFSKSTSQS